MFWRDQEFCTPNRASKPSVSTEHEFRCRPTALGYRLLPLLIALAILCPALAAPAAADSPMPENQVPG